MRPTLAEKRAAFRALHAEGCFVMPNAWDAGSAVILQAQGFKALASTSAGMAWASARADYGVQRDVVLAHLRMLTQAVDLPINADFENAFADAPEGVAANVTLAVEAGVAGLSVEDASGDKDNPIYDFGLTIERVIAAREAIDATKTGVVLTVRAENFLNGRPDLDDTLRRVEAFVAAGADCVFTPGVRQPDQIAAVVAAAGGVAVNAIPPGLPVAAMAQLGVRRISVGGSLARAAYAALLAAAQEMAGEQTFGFMASSSSLNLNALFAEAAATRGPEA